MYLAHFPELKLHLWEQYHLPMMARLKLELGESLPGIFALNDIRSLLALQRPEVQERVAIAQMCIVEGMILMGLNEIFHPISFDSRLEEPFTIVVPSLFRYGLEHHIHEHASEKILILSQVYPTNPSRNHILAECKNLDEVINTMAGFEQHERESKRARNP